MTEPDLAGRDCVQPRQAVHQGRLPGSRRTHDRDSRPAAKVTLTPSSARTAAPPLPYTFTRSVAWTAPPAGRPAGESAALRRTSMTLAMISSTSSSARTLAMSKTLRRKGFAVVVCRAGLRVNREVYEGPVAKPYDAVLPSPWRESRAAADA